VRENAIYDLSDALIRIREHEFPTEFTDTTRVFFAKAGAMRHGRARAGDAAARCRSRRRRGRSDRQHRQVLPLDAAHDLRRDR
jgi:hypothetical protein